MNWALVVGGSIALLASAIHGVLGDAIVRRIDADALPESQFGGGGSTKFLIRVSWHFTTLAFVVAGVGLVTAGMNPISAAAPGLVYAAGALITCWTVFGLIGGYTRGGVRAWLSHPAPLMLALTSVLIWWGATRL